MTGAYFGAKSGCEPVHILWDSHADVIKVANNTPKATGQLMARMRVYSLEGRELSSQGVTVSLQPISVVEAFPLRRPDSASGVFFVKLTLERGQQIVSENFYWNCAEGGSCKPLDSLPAVALTGRAQRVLTKDTLHFTVTLRNPTQTVAPAVRLKVQGAKSGKRVLPVFYSDNYFGLLPGASKTVTLELAAASLAGDTPSILMEGWNITPQRVAEG
jgi:hypothetical protein